MTYFRSLSCAIGFLALCLGTSCPDREGPGLRADDPPPGPAHAMLRLLASGRLSEDRLPTVVRMVCERGNARELAVVVDEALREDHWPASLRAQTLGWLSQAARTRKVIPARERDDLVALFEAPDAELQRRAIELAGAWQLAAAVEPLRKRAADAGAAVAARRSALAALIQISRGEAVPLLDQLTEPDQAFPVRSMAVQLLAEVSAEAAAARAAAVLQQLGPEDNPGELLESFLLREDGSDRLAAHLDASPPSADDAKRLLREMYARGRADAALGDLLARVAGIGEEPAPLTPEELQALLREVADRGDPVRGEAVFRREDLSCLRCHAVSGAGGQVGPDLSAVGSSSPLDYLALSVLEPDQAIKEAYATRLVLTVDGRVHQGILVSRTRDALTLKDASGAAIEIPVDDIEAEREGKSLMPRGLVKFLTRDELVDLVAFLAALGKPGPFAVRTTPRLQRYRLLTDIPADWDDQVPSTERIQETLQLPEAWRSVVARVNGDLPLDELAPRRGNGPLYLYGEVQTLKPGPAELLLDDAAGVTVWLDDRPLTAAERVRLELTAGAQKVVIRVDRNARTRETLRVEFSRPANSPVDFTVVDGL